MSEVNQQEIWVFTVGEPSEAIRREIEMLKMVYPTYRVNVLKIKPDKVDWVMSYVGYPPEEVPPMIRSAVKVLAKYNIKHVRQLPAVGIQWPNGFIKVCEGEAAVVDCLRELYAKRARKLGLLLEE